MKIIADSSSTRTEWVIVDGDVVVERAYTHGLNPYFQSRREISHSIRLELPESFFRRRWEHIFFYGAGCANVEKNKIMEQSLVAQFKTPVTVESDLLGAARGLLVRDPGLACILGTGSNSCYYDGLKIIKNVRSLGFILGDEGSGASIGKQFLSDCFKGIAPIALRDEFYNKYNISYDEVMDAIYMNSFPNRTLSKYSMFLMEHTDNEYVYQLIYSSLMSFFVRNISAYKYEDLPICFVGSTAINYSKILQKVASDFGVEVSKIERSSMPGLIKFHSN